MKKAIVVALFATVLFLHAKHADALTIKGLTVEQIGKLPGRGIDAFKRIKEIIGQTRTTIDTIQKNVQLIKEKEQAIKQEPNLIKQMDQRRALVGPAKEMIQELMLTVSLFVAFTDNHLNGIVKIINKDSGQKIEEFTQKLNDVLARVNSALVGVLDTLEPKQETIDKLQEIQTTRQETTRQGELPALGY